MLAVSRLSLIVLARRAGAFEFTATKRLIGSACFCYSHDRSKAEPFHSASDLLARSLRYTHGPFARMIFPGSDRPAILVAGHFAASLTTSLAQRLFHPLLGCRRKSILGKCVGM